MHKSESYNIIAVQGKISKRWLLYKGPCLLFEQYIYKNEGFKPTSRKQIVAEISAIHRSTLQSVLLANLYFNYAQYLVGPTGFNCWTSVAPAFQSWFAVEYSSCFIPLMNLYLYVRCFDSLMSRGPSRGPNNFYVYMNHSRT